MRPLTFLLVGQLVLDVALADYIKGYGHICLQHLGSFDLTWRVVKQHSEHQDFGTAQRGQAQCLNLTKHAGLRSGDHVMVEAFVNKIAVADSSPILYNKSSPLWVTYVCRDISIDPLRVICHRLMEGSPTPELRLPATCGLSVVDREACGDSGINQSDCLSKRCCWQELNPNPVKAPSCFRKGAGGNQLTPPNKVLPFSPAECFVTDATYDVSELVQQNDVVYGAAVNPYIFGFDKTEILKLDVLSPPMTNTKILRPALIWIHGGTFIDGDKSDDKELREALASRGYVVLSINYRLVSQGVIPDYGALFTIKPAVVAMEDARAAVRFVRKNAERYQVDTSRIAVGGESAGALTANMYGFGKGFNEGESGNAGYDSSVNGVLSVSGSARDLAMCAAVGGPPAYQPYLCLISSPPGRDLTKDLESGDVPVVDLHGTNDATIPYISGKELTDRATAVGVRNLLLTIPGAGHVPMGNILDPKEPYFLQWLNFTAGFLNLAGATCPSQGIIVV